MAKLIVNADDFGFSSPVNQAIIQAHQDGIVTSSTVMINLPDAPSGLQLVQQAAPNLALGLHLNLTDGSPVSEVDQIPSLVDENGMFYPIERLSEVALQYDADELYQELAAQFDYFIELTGKLPTHLDSHYHIALMHPAALEATLAIASEHQLPLREVLPDSSLEQAIPTLKHFIPNMPDDFITMLWNMLQEVLGRSPQPLTPAQFINRFSAPTNTLGDLLNVLTDVAEMERPAEIMCHPGLANDPKTSIAHARQQELDALCHPATLEVVEKFDIELVNFGTLNG